MADQVPVDEPRLDPPLEKRNQDQDVAAGAVLVFVPAAVIDDNNGLGESLSISL